MYHPPPLSPRSRSNMVTLFRGSATLGLFLGLMNAAATSEADSNVVRVNLGDFSGDEQLTQAVAETLITDLAKSGRISVLGARGSRDSDPEEGAYVLAGSCLVFDNNVVINARLIDSATGRTLPGAAENVDGPKSQVFTLVHSLAGKLTARVTGDSGSVATPVPAATNAKRLGSSVGLPSIKPSIGLPLPRVSVNPGSNRSAGVPPVRTRPPVVAREVPPDSRSPEVGVRVDPGDSVDDGDPVGAENPKPNIGRSRRVEPEDGVDRGDPANVPIPEPRSGHQRVEPSRERVELPRDRVEEPDPGARYTSLIIDARGLDLERSMSPTIRRRDGGVVWNGGEANPDYVISDGIVVYAMTMREARDMARAGARPLIIEAVARHETPFPSDPYVDDEDADYILKAAKHDGFLKKFRVIFVIGR